MFFCLSLRNTGPGLVIDTAEVAAYLTLPIKTSFRRYDPTLYPKESNVTCVTFARRVPSHKRRISSHCQALFESALKRLKLEAEPTSKAVPGHGEDGLSSNPHLSVYH